MNKQKLKQKPLRIKESERSQKASEIYPAVRQKNCQEGFVEKVIFKARMTR